MEAKKDMVDLNEFITNTISVKLWNITVTIRKPSVEEFLIMMSRTDELWENMAKDAKIMIDILAMLIQNRGFLGRRVRAFKIIMKSLDISWVLTVWNKCFLELGVIPKKDDQIDNQNPECQ